MSPAASAVGSGSKNAHGALREWAQQYSVESEPLGRGSFASVRETRESGWRLSKASGRVVSIFFVQSESAEECR